MKYVNLLGISAILLVVASLGGDELPFRIAFWAAAFADSLAVVSIIYEELTSSTT